MNSSSDSDDTSYPNGKRKREGKEEKNDQDSKKLKIIDQDAEKPPDFAKFLTLAHTKYIVPFFLQGKPLAIERIHKLARLCFKNLISSPGNESNFVDFLLACGYLAEINEFQLDTDIVLKNFFFEFTRIYSQKFLSPELCMKILLAYGHLAKVGMFNKKDWKALKNALEKLTTTFFEQNPNISFCADILLAYSYLTYKSCIPEEDLKKIVDELIIPHLEKILAQEAPSVKDSFKILCSYSILMESNVLTFEDLNKIITVSKESSPIKIDFFSSASQAVTFETFDDTSFEPFVIFHEMIFFLLEQQPVFDSPLFKINKATLMQGLTNFWKNKTYSFPNEFQLLCKIIKFLRKNLEDLFVQKELIRSFIKETNKSFKEENPCLTDGALNSLYYFFKLYSVAKINPEESIDYLIEFKYDKNEEIDPTLFECFLQEIQENLKFFNESQKQKTKNNFISICEKIKFEKNDFGEISWSYCVGEKAVRAFFKNKIIETFSGKKHIEIIEISSDEEDTEINEIIEILSEDEETSGIVSEKIEPVLNKEEKTLSPISLSSPEHSELLLNDIAPLSPHHDQVYSLKNKEDAEALKVTLQKQGIHFEIECVWDLILKQAPGLPKGQLGVFTQQALKKGDILGDYHGEYVAANDREENADDSYVFDHKLGFFIDALKKRNFTAYVNSSPKPNVIAYIFEEKILFFALRDIEIGEQILIDYGQESYFDSMGFKPYFISPWDREEDFKQSLDDTNNHQNLLDTLKKITRLEIKGLSKLDEKQPDQPLLFFDTSRKALDIGQQHFITPFMLACFKGEVENVKKMFEKQPRCLWRYTRIDCEPPLFLVCRGTGTLHEKAEIIRFLLEKITEIPTGRDDLLKMKGGHHGPYNFLEYLLLNTNFSSEEKCSFIAPVIGSSKTIKSKRNNTDKSVCASLISNFIIYNFENFIKDIHKYQDYPEYLAILQTLLIKHMTSISDKKETLEKKIVARLTDNMQSELEFKTTLILLKGYLSAFPKTKYNNRVEEWIEKLIQFTIKNPPKVNPVQDFLTFLIKIYEKNKWSKVVAEIKEKLKKVESTSSLETHPAHQILMSPTHGGFFNSSEDKEKLSLNLSPLIAPSPPKRMAFKSFS